VKIRIDRLDENNLDDFADLLYRFFRKLRRKQGWRPPARTDLEEESQKAFRRNDIVLMGYEKSKPLGFVRVSTCHKDAVFWIEEIFVVPEFRRIGIAPKLVKAAENGVLGRGEKSIYHFVLLQVLYSFWKSMGCGTLNSIELVKDLHPVKRDEICLRRS